MSLGFPSFQITENGKPKTLYVASNGGASASGNSFTVEWNHRIYLADKNANGFGPDIYYSPNLLGSTVQYDIDLGGFECSCVAAFYLISMPAYDSNQNPTPSSSGDYYCDANCITGTWCPEYDIMEANKHAWANTPHKCDPPNGKHYNNCDKGGNGWHFHSNCNGQYGPGKTIDTSKKFTVKHEFIASGGQLSQIKISAIQGSNVVSVVRPPGSYNEFTNYLKEGMVFSISSWSASHSNLDWL
jgi:hypothetical protein